MLAGGVALVLEQGLAGTAQLMGLLAVLVATAAWGADNTLSRAVAERDPGQVVLVKSSLGACATAFVAYLLAEPVPGAWAATALVAIGATGYGLSLRFYLLAQRAFGAGRTGSVFAFAPFIGAAGAFAMGSQPVSWMLLLGGILMLTGVVLHLVEDHGHAHDHSELEHEHAHRHDDGHHLHVHDQMPAGEHSHPHRHETCAMSTLMCRTRIICTLTDCVSGPESQLFDWRASPSPSMWQINTNWHRASQGPQADQARRIVRS